MYLKKIIIIIIILFISILAINKLIEKKAYIYLEDILNSSQRIFIKKYLQPYKYISKQQKIITDNYNMESDFKKSNVNILVGKMKEKSLTNNKTIKRYNLVNGFYLGMNKVFPGSGFIDFDNDNLLVLSSRGVLGYTNDLENELNFKQIKNNIDEYININQFLKNRSFSLKDLLISGNKIFVSYSEEIEDDCWNTSIIIGNMNYNNINFKKLFSANECVHFFKNKDRAFHPHVAGGRIVAIDSDHVVLTIGPYRSRFLAQDKKSVNGKLIKINIDNSNYEVISMGHRNPQGLYYDKDNDFLLETEHGPQGGDEINLIEINNINKDKIPNYGWAIASAGEHYGGKIPRNKEKYLKYPLYKSHSKHGFIEPLKSFVPSIGISEITKIKNNKYVVSSLKDRSLYFFELKNRQIVDLERVEVFERVRDLKFKDNKLYLFLEDTPSIGIINLN
tara:strand:- start:1600 stop:2943 length:1344 start_codon:yes stop_codon:yes gene_type:complete